MKLNKWAVLVIVIVVLVIIFGIYYYKPTLFAPIPPQERECTTNADCFDGNECTKDVCITTIYPYRCSHTTLETEGKSCWDFSLETSSGKCRGGVCTQVCENPTDCDADCLAPCKDTNSPNRVICNKGVCEVNQNVPNRKPGASCQVCASDTPIGDAYMIGSCTENGECVRRCPNGNPNECKIENPRRDRCVTVACFAGECSFIAANEGQPCAIEKVCKGGHCLPRL